MLDKAHKGRARPVDMIVKPNIIFVGMESKSVGIVVVGEGNGCVVLWRRQLRKKCLVHNTTIGCCLLDPSMVLGLSMVYFLPRKY
jgi:hypothetical protein